MPRVSVVLPTYNRGALVCEAVASVLDQTFTDLEVVVVNDGSADDTAERLAAIRDSRLRVIHQANAGLSAARNTALQHCRGDLIALLDDDDVWLDFKLATQVALLDAHPDCRYVFSEFYAWIPGRSETPGGLRRWFEQGWFDLDGPARHMLDAGSGALPLPPEARAVAPDMRLWKGDLYFSLMVGPVVLPSTAVFRRDAVTGVDEAFPVDDVHCGDWAFFARLSRDAPALFMDTPTVLNRSHHQAGRLTQASQRRQLEKELAMLEGLWGEDPAFQSAHGGRYQSRRKRLLMRLGKARLRDGDSAAARRAVTTAWRLPGPVSAQDVMLGGAVTVPGLDRLVRAFDATRQRWRLRRSPAGSG